MRTDSNRPSVLILSAIRLVLGCFATVAGQIALGDEARATPVGIEGAFVATTIKIKAMPDAVDLPLEWKFTNHSDLPLMVEKIDQSCGCLAGALDQQSYESGKSGVIRATFTPGTSRGLVRKSLHVRFVGYDKPVELIVEATVASSVELSIRELEWKRDEKITAQTIDVTSGTGADFSIVGLQGVSESQFTITQETISPLGHYRIQITPATGLPPGMHCLQVRTDSADPRDQVLPVFLRISQQPAVDGPSSDNDATPAGS